jgi:hypothetical protein
VRTYCTSGGGMHQTLRIEHAVVSLQAASCYIQFIHETLFYTLDHFL